MTWVLILVVYNTYPPMGAIASVPDFTSEAACLSAGRKAKADLPKLDYSCVVK